MQFDLCQWLRDQCAITSLPIQGINLDNLTAADEREWLVTNGLGSYASASVSGANTRRYHGLFVGSLNPPVERVVFFSRLDERVSQTGRQDVISLGCNIWRSGAVAPHGHKHMLAFAASPVPTFCYQLPGGKLIKQVLMKHGEQHVYIGYSYVADVADSEITLDLSVLLNYRDFHSQTRGSDNWQFSQEKQGTQGSVKITAFNGAQPFFMQSSQGEYQVDSCWYRDYFLPREYERGLADSEDCLGSGQFVVKLKGGESFTIAAGLSLLTEVPGISELVQQVAARQNSLLQKADVLDKPAVVQRLVLAGDQFLSRRKSTGGFTIVAGYPWFSDWGRDSMISLTGLCLSTGRYEEARGILATFGRYCSQGMLPNYFPDNGQAPAYNTSDATLWWAYALYRYYQATGDKEFVLEQQLPLMRDVIKWHQGGTRHGIKLDVDSLITGGNEHVQLTWMDAKCGDYVVTPRAGKAVEINALWHNFARTMTYLHHEVYGNLTIYAGYEIAIQQGFEKFWNEKGQYLNDVIRLDGTTDDAVRPNQLFAASLPYPVISRERAQSVLKVVEAELLTPMGLRTLSPSHPDYKGFYGLGKAWANQYDRDITYHQGTVWPWLLGAWVNARVYAYGQSAENFALIANQLKPLLKHFEESGCIGSISEIFDGESPHKPQGCVAQAWSVAELLRIFKDYPQVLAALEQTSSNPIA